LLGVRPNCRLNSRLNCDALSYPTARAAVLAGSGLVTVATARDAVAPIQVLVPEAMVDPLPQGEDGAITGEGLAELLGKATAVAVGPGLGTGDGPRRALDLLLERWDGPLVVDADGLTLLAGRLEVLRGRLAVLTPHPGELARILGVGTGEVTADRVGAARRAVAASGAVVLAKGARTLVVDETRCLVNPTGGPGLASGGTGDVLTGTIGALLAQGLPPLEAAAAGAWLHGRAAELAAERFPGAVPARVVAGRLPRAEAELRGRS
jgi:NAD(P)H-hydrate epimerase